MSVNLADFLLYPSSVMLSLVTFRNMDVICALGVGFFHFLNIPYMKRCLNIQLLSMFEMQVGIKDDDAEFIVLSTHIICTPHLITLCVP